MKKQIELNSAQQILLVVALKSRIRRLRKDLENKALVSHLPELAKMWQADLEETEKLVEQIMG